MIVEFFGTVRLRAGVASIEVEASTLGEALGILSHEIPSMSGAVIVGDRVHPAFRVSLNGERFVDDPVTPIGPTDRVLILAADAGG